MGETVSWMLLIAALLGIGFIAFVIGVWGEDILVQIKKWINDHRRRKDENE